MPIALDTSAARNIHAIGLSKSFVKLVQQKSWTIVTTQFIEEEISKQGIPLLDDLDCADVLKRHTIPTDNTDLRRAEEAYYKTFKQILGSHDAELLAATIAHYRRIITDDFSSLRAIKNTSPPLYNRIKANCVVHIICKVEAEGLIPHENADAFYNRYKTSCFDEQRFIPRQFREVDYENIKKTLEPTMFD